jgi:hypothetical protein
MVGIGFIITQASGLGDSAKARLKPAWGNAQESGNPENRRR